MEDKFALHAFYAFSQLKQQLLLLLPVQQRTVQSMT